jgi:hypothetical protein
MEAAARDKNGAGKIGSQSEFTLLSVTAVTAITAGNTAVSLNKFRK